MGCLKLQPGTLKQCLEKEDGHPGECIFTLLRPEVAAAQDKRKERDQQLVRRQVAQGFIPALLESESMSTPENFKAAVDNVVGAALDLADALIAKTGGFGP